MGKKRKGAAYRRKKQARHARLAARSARIAAEDAARGPGGLIGRIASIGTPDFVRVIDGGTGPLRVRELPRRAAPWIGARLQHARSVATAHRIGASADTFGAASVPRDGRPSMTDNVIVPCIWFDDQAEQAAAL